MLLYEFTVRIYQNGKPESAPKKFTQQFPSTLELAKTLAEFAWNQSGLPSARRVSAFGLCLPAADESYGLETRVVIEDVVQLSG